MFNDRELATVLAGLRQLQVTKMSLWVRDIYTKGHTLKGLTAAEINELCERLNTEPLKPNVAMPQELPIFEGWTVDVRCKEFRQADGDNIIFLSFYNATGDALLARYIQALPEGAPIPQIY